MRHIADVEPQFDPMAAQADDQLLGNPRRIGSSVW